MLRALDIAKQSTERKKHGVVIAKGRRVLAVGVNTNRNIPNNVTNPKLHAAYHAEINALKQVRSMDLSDATLYSARVNALGEAVIAKPCDACWAVIIDRGLKKVYWT